MTQIAREKSMSSYTEYPPLSGATSSNGSRQAPNSSRFSRPLPVAPTFSETTSVASGYMPMTVNAGSFASHSSPSSSYKSQGGKGRKGSYDARDAIPDYSIISFKNTSQYSKGGPSSCGLAAVNSSSRILPMVGDSGSPGRDIMEVLKLEDTATSIMSICSFWDSDDHLEVQDILDLPLFSCHLECVRVVDDLCNLASFRKLTRSLANDAPAAAIITRSPEILCLMSLPSTKTKKSWSDDDEESHHLTVIFDSHPRPEHPLGAAFLVFPSPDSAASYLAQLFAVDPSVLDADMGWQGQLLARYSAHVLRARQTTDEEEMDAVYAANIKLLGANVAMKEAVVRESTVQTELNQLRYRLERTKEKRREIMAAEADADRRLKEMKQQLSAAKETANILRQSTGAVNLPPYDPNQRLGGPDKQGLNEKKSGKDSIRGYVPNEGSTIRMNGIGQMDDEVATYERARRDRLRAAYPSYKPDATEPLNKQESYRGRHSTMERTPTDATIKAQESTTIKGTLSDRELALEIQRQFESEREDFEQARRLQMEEDRARHQHQKLTQSADPGFECKICLDRWESAFVSIVDLCKHEMCRECMKSHIQAELEHKRWPILCPLCRADPKGEPGIIDRRLVEMIGADEEMLDKWTKIELSAVSVQVECPSCKKTANIDAKDHADAEMLVCPHNCGAYWCKKCMQMGERGKRHTCNGDAEFERWREEQGDVRACPGCKTPVQRNEGCRHMTCISPGCNTHFCDRCNQLIVKSVKKAEIDAAVQRHFSGGCNLFDYKDE